MIASAVEIGGRQGGRIRRQTGGEAHLEGAAASGSAEDFAGGWCPAQVRSEHYIIIVNSNEANSGEAASSVYSLSPFLL